MGGSKPSPPTVVQAPPATIFQSIIPKKDYERLAKYTKQAKAGLKEVLARRDAMVGTPTDIANRMAERDVLTSAAYRSSLPTGERTGKYDAVKAAANQALKLAKVRRKEISEQPDMPSA
jgi:hypothetical protein